MDAQSCSIETDSPGARTVKSPTSTAVVGTYLTLTPVKEGWAPVTSVIANVSVGSLFKGPRGSFKILSVSSPVLVSVVDIFRFSTVLTEAGPVLAFSIASSMKAEKNHLPAIVRDSDCDADTIATSDARERNVPVRDWENMMMKMDNFDTSV